MEGIARINNQCIYIVDFYKGTVWNTSNIPVSLFGIKESDIEDSRERIREKYVSPEDSLMMVKVTKAWFSFLMEKPLEERELYSLRFDYHLNHHFLRTTMTPVFLSVDGKPWIVLCKINHNHTHKKEKAMIFKHNSALSWSFSEKEEWLASTKAELSEIELNVILLSLQGHTEENLCKMIFRSKDGLKSIKKRIFKKLEVRNITEAISYAISHGLIML